MKSAFKFAFTGLGLMLIAIGIGAGVFVSQAERFITKSIAEIMTDSFGSAARLDHITVAPARRELVLHEFSLDNPKSFKDGKALQSEQIILVLDPFTLFSSSPVIEKMTLENTHIQYRLEVPDGTNVGVLANQLEERAERNGGRTFVIEKLICKDAAVEFTTHLIPKNIDLNLVTVELDNIDDGAAISTSELTSIFLRSVIKETLSLNGILSPIFSRLKSESGEEDDDEENPGELEEL